MIKLQIVGNLGKDCIVKEINGKNVINFSVAHTERY
ncbi:MAG: single-stranded DNA-binding protein, partial [Sphingobacteriales bacterium]|nr:single-stranded DNA-binding protein [Sphingobacteriales bacterium]